MAKKKKKSRKLGKKGNDNIIFILMANQFNANKQHFLSELHYLIQI